MIGSQSFHSAMAEYNRDRFHGGPPDGPLGYHEKLRKNPRTGEFEVIRIPDFGEPCSGYGSGASTKTKTNKRLLLL